MNRIIITLICIIVVICAMFTASQIVKDNNDDEITKIAEVDQLEDEIILDDCTDEYEEIEKNSLVQANSEDEKVSPNCSFTQKIYYKKCEHIISKYLELPNEIVNLNREELEKKYPDWKLEKFSSNEIILYKEVDSTCDEHYLIKNNEGKITIYRILDDGTQKEEEKTDISTEYLTDTDKIEMEKGIKVTGKQKLNELIENFE